MCFLLNNAPLTSLTRPTSGASLKPFHGHQGIAVDWIAGNVYWVNYNQQAVEVATKLGKYRRTLYQSGISDEKLHDIVVHPSKG